MNKNARLKYLKYAIGETVLVVVGILIALGINNWNNQLQEANNVNGYLQNIAKNINADQEGLKTITLFRENSIVSSKYFMGMVSKDYISKEAFMTYLKLHMQYMPMLDESFEANVSGFEALKNSGFLSKLHGNNLENDLYDYYSLVDKINTEESSLNNFMEEMEYDMYKNNVVQEVRRLMTSVRKNIETPNDMATLQTILRYPALVGANSRNTNVDYLLEPYRELMIIGNKILREVNMLND